MSTSKMQKLVASLKRDIILLEKEVSNLSFLQSKKYDEFSKWFIAVENNTFDSLRSCLSRLNMIEKGLDLDLAVQSINSLNKLDKKITSKNFSVAQGTLKNYKSAIKTLIRYKEHKNEK